MGQGVGEAARAFFGMGCACGFTAAFGVVLLFLLLSPWLKCFLSGSGISALHILGMRLRGTPVHLIADAHIALVQRGVAVDHRRVESCYLANPGRIQSANDLIEAVLADLSRKPNAAEFTTK